MTAPTQRPFTASTNKLAYAQAFTARGARRPERTRHTAALLHRGVAAVRGRARHTRSVTPA